MSYPFGALSRMSTSVLVHGGGGSHREFELLEPELRSLGHDVVAPDLPIDGPAAGFAELTQAVVDAVGDCRDLVVVGHSYGGFTAPLVCAPARPAAGVSRRDDPRTGEKPGDWRANTGFEGPKGSATPRRSTPAFRRTWPPARSPTSARRSAWSRASPGRSTRCRTCRPRVLLCRHDRFFTPDFQRRVARDRLGLEPDEIDGAHCVPDQ